MNRTKLFAIVALSMMLGACASVPQQSVAFDAGAIAGSDNRVAIQMKKIPATDTSFPGASGPCGKFGNSQPVHKLHQQDTRAQD